MKNVIIPQQCSVSTDDPPRTTTVRVPLIDKHCSQVIIIVIFLGYFENNIYPCSDFIRTLNVEFTIPSVFLFV
jgi:hypothetical protein